LTDALLIFLGRGQEIDGWLRLADGAVAARGASIGEAPAVSADGEALPVVAVVPGDAVTLHWLEMPAGLAPAQAAAAARLIAAEASAQPLADMHVAVGAEADDEVVRPVALVPALAMAGWLGRLQAAGLDPDLVLPEPLLLQPPAEGIARYGGSVVPLYRGATEAFAMEPELAALVLNGAAIVEVDDAAFEAGLAPALDAPAVNLRQGPFAKRRRWRIDWKLARRLALLAAAILIVTLGIQIASILRYTFAADRLEAETRAIAAQALPGAPSSAGASALLEQRLAELRGGGVGYGAISAALFGAVRATANAELSSLLFNRDGTLKATVQADTPATVEALARRIEEAGFAVEASPARPAGGRQAADLTVRPS
jgi:general secretion pathway protein L